MINDNIKILHIFLINIKWQNSRLHKYLSCGIILLLACWLWFPPPPIAILSCNWQNWSSICSWALVLLCNSVLSASCVFNLFTSSWFICLSYIFSDECTCFNRVISFHSISMFCINDKHLQPLIPEFTISCFRRNLVLCLTTSICRISLQHKYENRRLLLTYFFVFEITLED